MKEGTGEKTYAFLVDCVESAIKVQEQKKNLLEKEMLLSNRRREKQVAIGATPPHQRVRTREERETIRTRIRIERTARIVIPDILLIRQNLTLQPDVEKEEREEGTPQSNSNEADLQISLPPPSFIVSSFTSTNPANGETSVDLTTGRSVMPLSVN